MELTEEIKNHILENRIILPNMSMTRLSTKEQMSALQLEISMLRGKFDEAFYQKLVVKFIKKGGHMKLTHCITDVTTDLAHGEIKRWDRFIEAVGQLRVYNHQSPRPELHAYMFDETCGESKIREAVRVFKIEGIKIFTFVHVSDSSVQLIDYASQEVMFTFDITALE